MTLFQSGPRERFLSTLFLLAPKNILLFITVHAFRKHSYSYAIYGYFIFCQTIKWYEGLAFEFVLEVILEMKNSSVWMQSTYFFTLSFALDIPLNLNSVSPICLYIHKNMLRYF